MEWQANEDKERIALRLDAWTDISMLSRLWERDPTIWFSAPRPEITDRLGWLELPERMSQEVGEWAALGEEIRQNGYEHVVLLGMGGSSLAPEVFSSVLGRVPDYPELCVLDSTHPDEIRALEDRIRLERTLFLVSSKSGTTLETLSLFRHFWQRLSGIGGGVGAHFAAVTDPGSPLEAMARARDFRSIFLSPPDVGGRYSGLAPFGLVPAVLLGLDVHELLAQAQKAARAHAPTVTPDQAPGVVLGAILGELACDRNKLMFLASSSLTSFPAWLEQLIAESTGKDNRGILPVAAGLSSVDQAGAPDRIYVFLSLEGDDLSSLSPLAASLERAGHPVVRTHLLSRYEIAAEMYAWEVATALASSVLGVNPFDQPDVQLAKELAIRAMKGEDGEIEGEGDTIFASQAGQLERSLRELLSGVEPGGYFALQAFLPSSREISGTLLEIQKRLQMMTGLVCTLGFGPRFLHSTGQLHKGGPGGGMFLQLVDEPAQDLPVPETEYSFARMIAAQSLGDLHALRRRGRRVLRVSLGKEREKALDRVLAALGRIHSGC